MKTIHYLPRIEEFDFFEGTTEDFEIETNNHTIVCDIINASLNKHITSYATHTHPEEVEFTQSVGDITNIKLYDKEDEEIQLTTEQELELEKRILKNIKIIG
ncbi:hypothetical protein [Seonamhaeicola sp.]|uniref:hypothetical protein n=1 Tax=Seonamhaeicola sp. TaxID=1912245 RepID=UPI0035682D88